jgi:hypothetical protein
MPPDDATKREVIIRRLRQDVPAMADLSQVGLEIATGARFDAHKYLIAHVMREIRTRLPLQYGVTSAPRFEYSNEIENFAGDWVAEVGGQLQGIGGARRHGRVSPRSAGRSDLHSARFWRASKWSLPDCSAIDPRTRANTSALAWIGATDRRAARTAIPQCSHGQERKASGAREIAAARNASQSLAATSLRK